MVLFLLILSTTYAVVDTRIGTENTKGKLIIVEIYAYDLGYGNVQFYNPVRGNIPMLSIDRLVKIVHDGHSSAAFCKPSRYDLLTGRHLICCTNQGGLSDAFSTPFIPKERLTIVRLAQQNGHRAPCVLASGILALTGR